MVRGVRAPPYVVRRERRHADDSPDPVVGQPLAEESAVAAIVLDGEKPDQEARCGDGQRQGEPVADIERRPGERPQGGERHDGDGDLDDAAGVARLPIPRQKLRPGTGIGYARVSFQRFLVVCQLGELSCQGQRRRRRRAPSHSPLGGQRGKSNERSGPRDGSHGPNPTAIRPTVAAVWRIPPGPCPNSAAPARALP